jgi:hypothetical protein
MRKAPLFVLAATLLLFIPAHATTLVFSQDTFDFESDPYDPVDPHAPLAVELFGIDEARSSFRLT